MKNISREQRDGALDSGNRTELIEGGALRDIQDKNGRCDLMPLDVISELLGFISGEAIEDLESLQVTMTDVTTADITTANIDICKQILRQIDLYMKSGNTDCLYQAITYFCAVYYTEPNDIAGGVSTALLRVSVRYREGAEKYAERNWEKGLPLSSFIDSGIRHLLKWLRCDSDEDHEGAFLWNMIGAIWTHKNKPECIGNMPFNVKGN